MSDFHIIPPDSPVYITKHGREELLKTADAQFDCVIEELRQMRDRFVEAGDFNSLEVLAQNLESEVF